MNIWNKTLKNKYNFQMFYHFTFLLKKKTYEKNTPPQECNTKPTP